MPADGERFRMKRLLLVAALAVAPAIVHAQASPKPPMAVQKPHTVKGPKDRVDLYYWLRDDTRKDPAVLGYLVAENAYADAIMAPLKPLQAKLEAEMIGRVKPDDSTVPVRKRGYFYYSRYDAGQDYAVVARKQGSLTARER